MRHQEHHAVVAATAVALQELLHQGLHATRRKPRRLQTFEVRLVKSFALAQLRQLLEEIGELRIDLTLHHALELPEARFSEPWFHLNLAVQGLAINLRRVFGSLEI
eukprot:Skav212666  [mRNA]  locus=scaffold1227:593590:596440:- [translate_table: standard]